MILAMTLAALAGALTWSLLEYVIHRFLGHGRAAKKNPFGVEHTAHHSRGHYFAPTSKKVLAAGLFMALVAPLAVLVAGLELGLAYAVGLVGFYGAYEVLHRRLHVSEGIGPFGRWARRHHFYHHFHDPSVNHGVTSPLWDWVFGTRKVVRAAVVVPEKLAMPWLVDPRSNEVWPHLAGRFALKARRR